jgi:DNA polymerase III subunit delta
MVALKAADVDRFLTRPDPSKPVVLVFGPDAGLVHERAEALIRSSVEDPRDPFALARIDGDLLADEPERLVEEAHTVPLFGGRRAVWVRAGGRNFVAAVERVLAAPPGADCRIVIEAGDLRRGAPLRSLCERAASAAALPCYADSARDLDRLIDEEMRSAELAIAPDARAMLASLIGGDRSASRSEIRKLALYAHGKSQIECEDVTAVVADATTTAVDALVDAAFAGRPADLETNFAKARASGVSASTIAMATSRQASALHRLRLTVEAGASIRAAIEGTFPVVHFSRRDMVQAALGAWTSKRLERLIVQLGETALDARKYNKLTYIVVQRALVSIAIAAKRKE